MQGLGPCVFRVWSKVAGAGAWGLDGLCMSCVHAHKIRSIIAEEIAFTRAYSLLCFGSISTTG